MKVLQENYRKIGEPALMPEGKILNHEQRKEKDKPSEKAAGVIC